jgi:inhibitor of cysteine peptidase
MKTEYLNLCALFSAAFVSLGQDSTPITVTNGQEFSVTLASNPTTGFRWDLARPINTNFVRLLTNEYVRPDSQLMGAGGNEVWKFRATSEGKTEIDLKYARPWEKEVEPAKKTNFFVVITGPQSAK